MHFSSEHFGNPISHYRPDIDGLRAIAVLSVLIYHAFPDFLPSGFIGVDVFFVISGYLICSILFKQIRENKFSLLDFYSRRIRRIFPALVTVLICSWVIAWFTLLPEEFKSLGKHILGGASFVSNLVLLNESGYFDASSSFKPLVHLWSLGVEEQFYLFWPIILWLIYRLRGSLIGITIAVLLISFSINIGLINNSPVLVFYSPITRVWELLFGALVAWILLENKLAGSTPTQIFFQNLSAFLRNAFSFSGIALLLMGLLFIKESSVFPGWWALLPVLGSMFLIMAGPSAWINRNILSARWVVWFGLISFPLYLWHWPLLSFARIIDGTSSVSMRLGIVFVSIIFAWLTYRFIEKPIRFGFGMRSKKNQLSFVWGLAVLMVVVAYMGYGAYIRDGIPVQRMLFRSNNPLLNEILTYKFPTGPSWLMGSCYLTENQSAADFKLCSDKIDPKKPTLVLWGDSHAAHLYPGFLEIYGAQYNLIYRSASACPPIIGLNKASRPFCKAINDSVFSLIQKVKPNVVVLAGNWRDNDWTLLNKTISGLKGLGVPNIDLVGPVPVWENNLPKQVFLFCKSNAPCEIPTYMQMGLVPQVFELDRSMRDFAGHQRVNYFSAIGILCSPQGCLIRTGDSGNTITTWDSEHLTSAGSQYLVKGFGSLNGVNPR